MEFAAIDFETTGYLGDGRNDPWQLGFALVRDFDTDRTFATAKELRLRVPRGKFLLLHVTAGLSHE